MDTPPTEPVKPASPLGKQLAIWGTVLQLGPLVGLLWVLWSVVQALGTLTGPGFGAGDQSAYDFQAQSVERTERVLQAAMTSLWPAAVGMAVGIVGLVLLSVALWGCRYRAGWFYWFMMLNAISLLLAFPIGTALGVAYLVTLLTYRAEFFPVQPSAATGSTA